MLGKVINVIIAIILAILFVWFAVSMFEVWEKSGTVNPIYNDWNMFKMWLEILAS